MPDNYDVMLKRVGEQDEEIKSLKKRVTNLEKTNADMEIEHLKQKVHDLEWRNRRKNLELHVILESENEDLLSKINEVAKNLDVPDLTSDQIIAAHRLPSRADKIPGVIVRFVSQATRDMWLDRRSRLRNARSKTHILENLTQQDKALLWDAKEWAKTNRFQYAWYKNGKILVREKDGTQAHLIKTKDDLQKLE